MSQELVETILLIFCICLILGFVFFIIYIVSLHQKNREKSVLEMNELKNNFQTEMLKSRLEIQEQTFEYISMEIHDNIGQLLSLSKLNLNLISQAPAEVLGKIQYSVDLLTRALDELRDLSHQLDADLIRDAGLYNAISEYIQQLRKSGGPEIEFLAQGHSNELRVESEIILFRILQEAVNNILKHAEATRINIELIFRNQRMIMTIRDNGKGFEPNPDSLKENTGAGIKNMQKRATLIRAEFSLQAETGKGTLITVSLPV